MTAPTRAVRSRTGSELAVEAPCLVRQSRVRRMLLALVTVPGLWLLYVLAAFGLRVEPAILVALVVHLVALAGCWLPPHAGPVRAELGPVGRLGALRAGLAHRHGRLALLRLVVTVEVLATFLWPVVAAVALDAPLRWSAWFTLSVAMLLVLRPIELIVRAEVREGRRLLRRTLDPSR